MSIELLTTQVGEGGGAPRGASISISEGDFKSTRFFRENGAENLSVYGDNYQVEVKNVLENTVGISIRRDIKRQQHAPPDNLNLAVLQHESAKENAYRIQQTSS